MDLTAPETTITVKPAAATTSANATFEFTSNEASTFECKLDSGSYSACTSPKSYTGLSEAGHTFQARATDAAGNVGNPAVYTWTIDTTPPETTITAHPDALTNSAAASFSFSSSETGSTFQCALDGAAFAACASPRSYTGLSDGSHTFQVKAGDGGGLTDPTPAVYTWSIDATPPDTTITQWPVTPSVGNTAVFTFSSETGATFECRLDSAAFATCTSPQNYTGLTDGSHTFQVRAKDAVGNYDPSPAGYTWTIDTTPPDTTITGQPAATTNSASATFTFSGVDADSFECKLDSGVYAACTSPQSYNGLAAGSHTFFVRAKDTEGRYDPTPAGYTWTVDANPPETTITGKPATTTNSTTADFTFTGVDAASFECKLDTAAFAACTSPKSYTGLAAGSHTFQVQAKDAAGNLDPSPAGYSWTIDTTPPTTTIDFTDVLPGSIHFTVQFTEPVNGFANNDVTLSGTAGATTVIVTNLHDRMEFDLDVSGMTGDGTIILTIAAGVATDAAGNGNTAATLTWTIETPGPDTSLDSYPPNPSNSATANFSFSGAGALSFECSLDDAPFAECASPHQVTNLADGPHLFAVRAVNEQGKVDTDYPIHSWIVDTTPPTTTIDFTDILPGSIHFTVRFTEPVNGFANNDVTLSGTAGATTVIVTNLHDRMEFDLDVSGMTGDGTIILTVAAGVATDAAGNGNTAATLTWTIDTTGPAVTITSAPPDPSDSDAATFTFTSEQGATFECSLDGADFAACASPQSYTGLSDGSHTFSVWATDAAGNTGNPAGHTWTITTTPADTTPPETTIDGWIGDVYTVDTITIEFSSEAGATFQCALDGAAWSDCASPITYNNLSDGPHTFQVRATDAAGNTDASPAADDWTVETPGPDTSLDSTPSNPSNSRAATFTFSSADASSFECSLDTAPFADCTSPHQVTGLTDGPHLFEVRAVTGQGKVDDTPAGYGWLVDATAPGATINQAAGQPDPATSGPIHFTVLFTEPVSGFDGDDVTLSGAAGATTVVVTNVHDRMEFDVAVSGMTGSGPVIATVAAGVAQDAAGNGNTASTSTDNHVVYDAGPPPTLYVTAAGGTANNDTEADVPYTKGDILKWDGAQWTKWFSSANWGLNPLADLIAFDVIDDANGSAHLVWRQTLTIRGLGRVMGHDITAFDGQTFSIFFDGSDVGLTAAGERIDGLEVLPGSGQCLHRLLISTVAGGSVRDGTNPTIAFTGEDVLSFCMTSSGMGTVGTWTLLEELQSEGLGRNNSLDIATAGDATDLIYFVPKKAFTLDGATVKPSEIAVFDRTTRLFSGPLWSAKAQGLTQLVDGIDVLGSLPD